MNIVVLIILLLTAAGAAASLAAAKLEVLGLGHLDLVGLCQ